MTTDAAALRGNWNYPTSVKFGCGRIKELADHCKALGMKRPLLITDPGLANLPMIKDAVARNNDAGVPTGLFSNVQGNPTGKNVEDGIAAYKAGGRQSGRADDRAEAPDLGLRGCRRLVDPCRSQRHRHHHRGADHIGHRLGSRTRGGRDA